MDDISTAVLSKALDGLYQRYLFTTQNIANANSPGYQPVRIVFEEALRAASHQDAEAVRHVRPAAIAIDTSDGPAVRLDLELAAATQTAMRYKALIEVLGRQLALSRAAITEWGR